jgi:hypothetical protein
MGAINSINLLYATYNYHEQAEQVDYSCIRKENQAKEQEGNT